MVPHVTSALRSDTVGQPPARHSLKAVSSDGRKPSGNASCIASARENGCSASGNVSWSRRLAVVAQMAQALISSGVLSL